MKKLLTTALALQGGLALALEPAPESDDSVTIYSRMQPGAVSPERVSREETARWAQLSASS